MSPGKRVFGSDNTIVVAKCPEGQFNKVVNDEMGGTECWSSYFDCGRKKLKEFRQREFH